jgi:hypothetical protein
MSNERITLSAKTRKAHGMTRLSVSIFFFLSIAMNVAPALSASDAEDALHVPMQLAQTNQAPRKTPGLEDSQMVKPAQKERDAVRQLLATKPPQKTLKDADRKYLKGLLDKPTWGGFERRIVHEMWTEMSGREWRDTEGP